MDSSMKLYNSTKNMQEITSHVVASILANNPTIIQGYLDNNRTVIINETTKIWGNRLKDENLIYEIHYFKSPCNSFVDFHDLSVYGQNLSNVRNDVVETFKEQKPSEHFWICSLYPGKRSTFPIKYKNRTIGVVSVGIKVSSYSSIFANSLNIKNMLVYSDAVLKKRLSPHIYKTFLKDKIKTNGWVIDAKFAKEYIAEISSIDFKKKQQSLTIKDVKQSIIDIPLLDKDGVLNGYLVLIKPLNAIEENNKLSNLILYILLTEMVLLVMFTYIFVFIDVKRIYNLIEYLKNIAHNKFTNIDTIELKNDKNEISISEKQVVDMAEKLSLTFNKFSQNLQEFQFQAEHDPLTGLLNRRTLDNFKADDLVNNSKNDLAVLMIDIDYFKKVNDTYGHHSGDIVLQELANIMHSVVRKDDLIFRYGGEEFCVVLKQVSKSEAISIAQKIRKSVSKKIITINDDKQTELTITISCGVSIQSNSTKSLDDLIQNADKRLYKAKETGRNKVIHE